MGDFAGSRSMTEALHKNQAVFTIDPGRTVREYAIEFVVIILIVLAVLIALRPEMLSDLLELTLVGGGTAAGLLLGLLVIYLDLRSMRTMKIVIDYEAQTIAFHNVKPVTFLPSRRVPVIVRSFGDVLDAYHFRARGHGGYLRIITRHERLRISDEMPRFYDLESFFKGLAEATPPVHWTQRIDAITWRTAILVVLIGIPLAFLYIMGYL
jgi:hypothetical protein